MAKTRNHVPSAVDVANPLPTLRMNENGASLTLEDATSEIPATFSTLGLIKSEVDDCLVAASAPTIKGEPEVDTTTSAEFADVRNPSIDMSNTLADNQENLKIIQVHQHQRSVFDSQEDSGDVVLGSFFHGISDERSSYDHSAAEISHEYSHQPLSRAPAQDSNVLLDVHMKEREDVTEPLREHVTEPLREHHSVLPEDQNVTLDDSQSDSQVHSPTSEQVCYASSMIENEADDNSTQDYPSNSVLGLKRKCSSSAIKTDDERKRMPRMMGGCKERKTKRTKAAFDQILNEPYVWEKDSYSNFLNQGYVWDPEYEEYQDLSIATPVFCLACGVNVGFGKKSMAQHIHGVNKKGKLTRHQLKVARMDPEILRNPPPTKPVTVRAVTAELMDANDMNRLAKKKYMKDSASGTQTFITPTPSVVNVGRSLLTGPVGKKSFQALLKEPYVWEGTNYDSLLGQTYTLHPNGRIVCKACNSFVDYSKRAMCQHVHGRKKGDKRTKHQENVMAYNEMIQKVHGGIEPEFNFADALGPEDVTMMGPIATAAAAAAAAAVEDQQERQLTVMERVMRIEKRWLGEMLQQGSMKDRMVNLEEFIFGEAGDGSFLDRLVKLENELKSTEGDTEEENHMPSLAQSTPTLFKSTYTPAQPNSRGRKQRGRPPTKRSRIENSLLTKSAEETLAEAKKHLPGIPNSQEAIDQQMHQIKHLASAFSVAESVVEAAPKPSPQEEAIAEQIVKEASESRFETPLLTPGDSGLAQPLIQDLQTIQLHKQEQSGEIIHFGHIILENQSHIQSANSEPNERVALV